MLDDFEQEAYAHIDMEGPLAKALRAIQIVDEVETLQHREVQKRQKIAFCDKAFSYLRDRFGWSALPQIHGLGVDGATELGQRYPWFSTDSVSWYAHRKFNRQISRQGKVLPYVRGARRTTRGEHALFVRRKLALWQATAEQASRNWELRGVTFV